MNTHRQRTRAASLIGRRGTALAPAAIAVSLATAALFGSAGAAAGTAPSPSHSNRALAAGIGGQFAIWAQAPGVQVVSGDVNRDGRADVLLTGGAGWTTIPVAFSRGNGTFRVTNEAVTGVPIWAQAPGVKVVAGDVNHDGRADLMLTRGPAWTTIPVAISPGNGPFRVPNEAVPAGPWWAQAPGVKLVAGDVNHDGRADLPLSGVPPYTTLPGSFSRGNGTFRVTNEAVTDVPWWAQAPGVKVVAGDVNHDGRADLMLTGGPGWTTIPVALPRRHGTFRVTNEAVTDVPWWAQAPGVKVVSGDVNHDGRADLMLTGGPGWTTIPVAFSRGTGTFRVTNEAVTDVPWWAQAPGVKAAAGNTHRC